MTLVRKQRRVGGKKVNYWLCTETGAEYDAKPERKTRADKKCVSQNNVITVALRLLYEYEVALTDALLLVYNTDADADALDMLQLIQACKDAVSEVVFLAGFCQPSYEFYRKKAKRATDLAYKFILEFFPDEMENLQNMDAPLFRTRRVRKERDEFDDGTGEVVQFRFVDKEFIKRMPLYIEDV